ncbi:hypothetical protein ENBRE01_1672 [Enteropsectra breve]|nr:hypothetical protein ENBRE01_1672 [Enteropsectra breve]
MMFSGINMMQLMTAVINCKQQEKTTGSTKHTAEITLHDNKGGIISYDENFKTIRNGCKENDKFLTNYRHASDSNFNITAKNFKLKDAADYAIEEIKKAEGKSLPDAREHVKALIEIMAVLQYMLFLNKNECENIIKDVAAGRSNTISQLSEKLNMFVSANKLLSSIESFLSIEFSRAKSYSARKILFFPQTLRFDYAGALKYLLTADKYKSFVEGDVDLKDLDDQEADNDSMGVSDENSDNDKDNEENSENNNKRNQVDLEECRDLFRQLSKSFEKAKDRIIELNDVEELMTQRKKLNKVMMDLAKQRKSPGINEIVLDYQVRVRKCAEAFNGCINDIEQMNKLISEAESKITDYKNRLDTDTDYDVIFNEMNEVKDNIKKVILDKAGPTKISIEKANYIYKKIRDEVNDLKIENGDIDLTITDKVNEHIGMILIVTLAIFIVCAVIIIKARK